MNRTLLIVCAGTIAISIGLGGCGIGLSGSASLSPDGTTAVLKGPGPMEVRGQQPELPPPPPPPAPVPQKAKIVKEKIVITEKVMFAFDKAEILPESFDLLNDVAAVMKQHPEVSQIRIEGHTDSTGRNKYNKKLSDSRANAVMDFLLKAGVEDTRMIAEGFGEDKPIADNDTDEGKAQNRRVEFNIIGRTGETPEEAPAAEAPEAAPTAETPEAAPVAAPAASEAPAAAE